MPIHDWTRVSPNTFHAFHTAWIAELQRFLNRGTLPDGYYALAEQATGDVVPDVLTLQQIGPRDDSEERLSNQEETGGGIAVAQAPPRVSVHALSDEALSIAARRKQLVIRHSNGDRIVALIEIVSPGNKEKRAAVEAFVDKAVATLRAGFHLLIVDLFPPGALDPDGMHGVVWDAVGGSYTAPVGKPLTLAAYVASKAAECYVEPTSVGTALIDMPLFLNAGRYVNVPLEATYLAAYEGVPQRWRKVIEG